MKNFREVTQEGLYDYLWNESHNMDKGELLILAKEIAYYAYQLEKKLTRYSVSSKEEFETFKMEVLVETE